MRIFTGASNSRTNHMINIPSSVYAAASIATISSLAYIDFSQRMEIDGLQANVRVLQEQKSVSDAQWKKAAKEKDALFMQNAILQKQLADSSREIYALRDAWRAGAQNELNLPSDDFHRGIKCK
jgi:cell division protein FtsB